MRFIARAALDNIYIFVRKLPPDLIAIGEKRRRVVMTTVWFFISLFLAVIVPNIGMVIALLGGLAAVFVFIFPG